MMVYLLGKSSSEVRCDEGLLEKRTSNNIVDKRWIVTHGDIDEKGYLAITDPKKDIIISDGENISSIKVKGVLYDHPDILEQL